MKTCDTCSHWTDEAPYDQPERFTVRVCGNEKLSEDGGFHEPDGLYYSYSEGGCFYTGPKFGCVHHMEKK